MTTAPVTASAADLDAHAVTLRYFAWVREKIGTASEHVIIPAHVRTVADMMAWLGSRGDGYAEAFSRPEVIRAAIDQAHVHPGSSIENAREIAFFPPVTGG